MSTRSPTGKVLVALATLVVAGATMALGLVRAEPAAAGASCVAVVVDFRQHDGAVQTGCAQGDPSTGLQALSRAGFGYTPRPRDGLICQIDSRPACTETTSTTYWSYWYRAAGSQRWVYASEGAGTHNPKPGSTEAWVWQVGGRTPPPSIRADAICPQLAATPTSTPKPSDPTSPASPRPSTKASTKATTLATLAPTRSAPRPTPATSAAIDRGSPDAPASPSTSSPASSSPAALSATAPSDGSTGGSAGAAGDQGGGGAVGGVAGAALGGVVVLGIGAATVIRARRGRPS